jgi:CxxC motif-containing protein
VDHLTKTTHFTDPRLIEQFSKVSAAPLIQAADASQEITTSPEPVSGGSGRNGQNNNAENSRRNASVTTEVEVQRAEPQQKPVKSSKPSEKKIEKVDIMVKLKQLRIQLQLLQPVTGHCRLMIGRDDVFEVQIILRVFIYFQFGVNYFLFQSSYLGVSRLRPKDLRKRLMVKFRGEEGLDYGGVSREWLGLLTKEMLDPNYGLFLYTEGSRSVVINAESSVNPVSLNLDFNVFKEF